MRRVMTVLSGELTRAVAHLHAKAQAFQAQLQRHRACRGCCRRPTSFAVLRLLLNPSPHKADGGDR